MNLVKIVNQHIDTDKSQRILPEETLVTFVRDMYSECERLASQYNGDNLLPLLLAAAYTGKAEGINETIAKQNNKDVSDREIIKHVFANKDTTDGPYLRAYKLYLQDNNLPDNSHTMTQREAFDFLLNNLSPDCYEELMHRSV